MRGYYAVIRVVKLKETLEFFEAVGITPQGKSVAETMAEVDAAKVRYLAVCRSNHKHPDCGVVQKRLS